MLITYPLWHLQMGSKHLSFGSAAQFMRHSRAIGHFLHPRAAGLRLLLVTGRARLCRHSGDAQEPSKGRETGLRSVFVMQPRTPAL